MPISSTLTPGTYNMAYGQNLYTFTGLTTEDKYVVRIKDGSTIFADLRQSPNPEDDAIFDVQNVLQSYVKPSHYWIEQLGIYDQDPSAINANVPYTNCERELFEYDVDYGGESNGVYTPIQSLVNHRVLGGTKAYYDNDWDYETYQPSIVIDDDQCGSTVPESTTPSKPLTDYDITKTVTNLSGGYPAALLGSTGQVLYYKLLRSQHLTMSYINELNRVSNAQGIPDAKSIEGFYITAYNGASQISQAFIPNLVANGCGPNVNRNDNNATTADTRIATIGIGPANLKLMRYYNQSPGAIQIYGLPSSTTHYYITTHSGTPLSCPNNITQGVSDEPLHTPIRIDIIEDTCLDYEPMEFSWQNSFGFRDYFLFNKKQQQSVSVSRNKYLNNPVSYSGAANDAGAIYGNRGYTTYSQKIEERYLATTGFMDDDTAMYLRNLYQSPDVRVRLTDKYNEEGDRFYPVNLLSSSWAEKNFQKDKLFQYEATFKLANNIKSMRG